MANAESFTADPLAREDVYMEVIIWKFVLNCTNSFLNTCSVFPIELNILVTKMGFTHEKRIGFYMTFLDGFTSIM
jgi:hypothetical protein